MGHTSPRAPGFFFLGKSGQLCIMYEKRKLLWEARVSPSGRRGGKYSLLGNTELA